jgi:penicillin-binding protein 2D
MEVALVEPMAYERFHKTIKYLRAVVIISLLSLFMVFLFMIGVFVYAKILGAPPLAVPQSNLYFSSEGDIIGESHNGQKRYWVPLEDISPNVIQATISIEDKNFYDHHGFDYKRMAGAIIADVKAMAKVQGASTITQQYARNLFLGHEKTWMRKLKEAFYTIRLEMNYTKKDILEGYLNTIYYGHGAYGIQAASQFYFQKNADELTVAEAALLASIPKGPSYYSPLVSYERAKERQAIVLSSMKKIGFITEEEKQAALNEPLEIVGQHQYQKAEIAPYFQDVVQYVLKEKLGIDQQTIEMGGLRVYTTLIANHQQIAEQVIADTIAPDSDIQIGFIAMNPHNGYVTALVGGRDYKESPYNRAVQAIRQPGSTIKPLLYYAALEQGFTPSTTMRSEQTTFRFDEGRAEYTPHNFNNKYAHDEITLAQALALSDNVYAVKTHLFLGEETLAQTAKRFGIKTPMKQVPSLALGTSGVRLIEITNAYNMFANGGQKVAPVFITKVENHQGEIIYEYEAEKEQLLDPNVAFVTAHLMTGMFDPSLNDYANVTGTTILKKITRPYGGKSGTTESDSWMIGFAPQLTAGVWTGYDQGDEITKVADKLYAKNVWVQFMEQALKDEPVLTFRPPKGTVGVYVNPDNGLLATKDCPVARLTYFVKGTEPTDYCHDHIEDGADSKAPAPSPDKEPHKSWFHRFIEWFGS